MTQQPILRAEVGMRVRCANKASAEWHWPKFSQKLQKHPRARNDYDEETAYESYMNPEPSFQSGPGDSVDAD